MSAPRGGVRCLRSFDSDGRRPPRPPFVHLLLSVPHGRGPVSDLCREAGLTDDRRSAVVCGRLLFRRGGPKGSLGAVRLNSDAPVVLPV